MKTLAEINRLIAATEAELADLENSRSKLLSRAKGTVEGAHEAAHQHHCARQVLCFRGYERRRLQVFGLPQKGVHQYQFQCACFQSFKC